jgi:hypothetical protein
LKANELQAGKRNCSCQTTLSFEAWKFLGLSRLIFTFSGVRTRHAAGGHAPNATRSFSEKFGLENKSLPPLTFKPHPAINEKEHHEISRVVGSN